MVAHPAYSHKLAGSDAARLERMMALLDRFRSSVPGRNPDPLVRLAYVEELPMTDMELIADAAREDPDPRVRRAAVGKLLDVPALSVCAREDADDTVRGRAVEMLRDLALEAFEGRGEAEALTAVGALTDVRALAHVAKTATREVVARAALERVTDDRMRGAIARHAALEPIRLEALATVNDSQEIVAIALNSEFKDTAVAAVDRLDDRATLEQIAGRARNKSASKRARGILRERDEEAARQAAAAAAPNPDAIAHSRRLHIVERLESLESASDLAVAERALADAENGWGSLEGMADADVAERYSAATARAQQQVSDARTRETERQRADADAARQQEAQDAAQQAQVAEAAAEDVARRQARLAELASEAEAAAIDTDLAAARVRIGGIRREWKDLSAGLEVDPAVQARYAEADGRVRTRENEAQDAEVKARRDALVRLQQLAVRLEALQAKADLTLKAGERALRDLKTALADVPPLPSRHDYEEITRRLKAAQTALSPRVHELREAEEWRRFANVAVQEQLIGKMEALKALEDPEAVARDIRALQQQWREAADVPRAQAEGLWHRFKAAHDAAWAKCEEHFAAQAEARAASLARKLSLCERAEALADSTRWIETAEEIKKLQADWKTIGAVTRGQEKAVWERFRVACDRFFSRRQADLTSRKKVWAENFARKEELCVRVEALAESTDWDAASAEIRKLQADWKTIGPVKKTRSEAIWQRFRAACDHFFARFAQRHDIARGERVAAREAICTEIEALAAAPADADPATDAPSDLLATVRDIRRRWQAEIAARGVDRERAMALDRRFNDAFDAIVSKSPTVFLNTDLDPEANRRRLEALVKRIEELALSLARTTPAADQSLSPTNRLAAMLKEALAANTIGGKVDDDSRWRAAAEDVRQAQASWSRIGPVSDEARQTLTDRFQRACRRISDAAARRPAPPRGR